MNTRMGWLGVVGLLTAGIVAGWPNAASADAARDSILIRQAGYSLLGATFGSMKPAEDKIDVKPLAARADAMVKWGKQMPLLFPAGSEAGVPTRALPAIWSDRAGFDKAAANFVEAAEKLSVLAKAGDADGFNAQWKVTGAACSACHTAYRAK